MENTLLMPFVGHNDCPEFVRGFEAGIIWEKLKQNQKLDNYIFHTANKEQIEMICKRYLCIFKIEVLDDTWSRLQAEISPSVN